MTVLIHQAHMIWLLVTNRDLLGEFDVIMNFNDQTDTIPMKDRGTLSSAEALIEVYMSVNEPQALRNQDEGSRATKF
jgi:hypothetical protein